MEEPVVDHFPFQKTSQTMNYRVPYQPFKTPSSNYELHQKKYSRYRISIPSKIGANFHFFFGIRDPSRHPGVAAGAKGADSKGAKGQAKGGFGKGPMPVGPMGSQQMNPMAAMANMAMKGGNSEKFIGKNGGKPMENLWKTYGNYMENIWKTYGKLWKTYGNLWKTYGNLWKTYGKPMEHIWKTMEKHMENIWKTYGKLW